MDQEQIELSNYDWDWDKNYNKSDRESMFSISCEEDEAFFVTELVNYDFDDSIGRKFAAKTETRLSESVCPLAQRLCHSRLWLNTE